jgi:hypothetical protein
MGVIGTKVHVAESKALISSGKVVVSLADLPAGRRIKQILLQLEMTYSVAGVALATALTSDIQTRIIDSVRLGKRIRATGLFLSNMDWMLCGKDFHRPATVPVTASTVTTRSTAVMIPFSDPKGVNPDDCAPNTEFYRDTPIEVGFANLSVLLPEFAKYTSVTGTLRTLVFHEAADQDVVPSSLVFNYDDWNQKTLYLPAGNYTHAFLYNEDGSDITAANVADVSLWVDGEKVLDQVKSTELGMFWNYYASQGISLRTDGSGAEALEMETPFKLIPLIFQSDKYKASKVISPEKNIRLDINGTATALRVAYRLIENKTPAQVLKAAEKIGIVGARTRPLFPKTASKSDGSRSPKLFRQLPVKFGR